MVFIPLYPASVVNVNISVYRSNLKQLKYTWYKKCTRDKENKSANQTMVFDLQERNSSASALKFKFCE